MARKTIFLESAFWDKFSECATSLFSDSNNPVAIFEKISNWNTLYKFICNSNIFTDTPLTVLGEKAKKDEFLRKLLKKNGDGKIELDQVKESPDLESSKRFKYDDDCSAIFFYSNRPQRGCEKAWRN